MPDPAIPPALLDRVLDRLGLTHANRRDPSDPADLARVYAAWCDHVPFDNVRKMIALRTAPGAPLPGIEPADFLAAWLEHGAGGTCWPSSNALFALLAALGFEARRVAASMRDLGVINHASIIVRARGDGAGDARGIAEWWVDSSMLTRAPLPLRAQPYVHDDPLLPAEVEPEAGTWVVWSFSTALGAFMPCRLLEDPVDFGFYASAYEASRERSPFNQRLYARRNRGGEVRALSGHTRYVQTACGVESRELTRDELAGALREDIGLSAALVERWAACGGLDASFAPPAGPKPPPLIGLPPSRRTPG